MLTQDWLDYHASALPSHCVTMLDLAENLLLGRHDGVLFSVQATHKDSSLATKVADPRLAKVLAPAIQESDSQTLHCLPIKYFSASQLQIPSQPSDARWTAAMQPTAVLSPTEEDQTQADLCEGQDGASARPSAPAPTRESEALRLAKAETDLFVQWITFAGDDAGALAAMLRNMKGLSEPLPSGGRLVLHWDSAKEAEASQAYTATHNVFTRVPKMNKQRARFFKAMVDSFALGEGTEFTNKARAWKS